MKTLDAWYLTEILTHCVYSNEENVFITLIQNGIIEDHECSVNDLAHLLYIDGKGTQSMRDSFNEWSGMHNVQMTNSNLFSLHNERTN